MYQRLCRALESATGEALLPLPKWAGVSEAVQGLRICNDGSYGKNPEGILYQRPCRA